MPVDPDLSVEYYKNILKNRRNVTLEDAIFRDETLFSPPNLKTEFGFLGTRNFKRPPSQSDYFELDPGSEARRVLEFVYQI